jgi:hypothetical protein
MKVEVGKYYLFRTNSTHLDYPKIACGKCVQECSHIGRIVFEVQFGGWHDRNIGDGKYWNAISRDIIRELEDYEIPIYILEEIE